MNSVLVFLAGCLQTFTNIKVPLPDNKMMCALWDIPLASVSAREVLTTPMTKAGIDSAVQVIDHATGAGIKLFTDVVSVFVENGGVSKVAGYVSSAVPSAVVQLGNEALSSGADIAVSMGHAICQYDTVQYLAQGASVTVQQALQSNGVCMAGAASSSVAEAAFCLSLETITLSHIGLAAYNGYWLHQIYKDLTTDRPTRTFVGFLSRYDYGPIKKALAEKYQSLNTNAQSWLNSELSGDKADKAPSPTPTSRVARTSGEVAPSAPAPQERSVCFAYSLEALVSDCLAVAECVEDAMDVATSAVNVAVDAMGCCSRRGAPRAA